LNAAKLMVENVRKADMYDLFKDEIDFRFYQLFCRNTVAQCLTKSSHYPKGVMYHEYKTCRESENIENNDYYLRNKTRFDTCVRYIEKHPWMGFVIFYLHKWRYRIKVLKE